MIVSTDYLRLSSWSGTTSQESLGIGSSCARAIRRFKSQRTLTRLCSAWKATRAPSPQSSPGEETRQRQVRLARDKKPPCCSVTENWRTLWPSQSDARTRANSKSPAIARRNRHKTCGYILHAVLLQCDGLSHRFHLPWACRNWLFAASI